MQLGYGRRNNYRLREAEISNFCGVSRDAIFLAVEIQSLSPRREPGWNWKETGTRGVDERERISSAMRSDLVYD